MTRTVRGWGLLALALAGALGGCAGAPGARTAGPGPDVSPLAATFDCLRTSGTGLVSAHRGQSEPTAAENAIGSFARTLAAGPILIELDVRKTADGVLVLMHDETLDRTTTGTGPVSARSFAEVRALTLRDDAGRLTGERVPTFAEALDWARRSGAMLQVDVKRGVSFAEAVEAVRAAGLIDRVVMITYTVADALTVGRLDRQVMISASIDTRDEYDALMDGGLDPRRLLVFTGTRLPDPAFNRWLAERRVETILGTLGDPDKSLDAQFVRGGRTGEYARLVREAPVALIASDHPLEAWGALEAGGSAGTRCLARTGG